MLFSTFFLDKKSGAKKSRQKRMLRRFAWPTHNKHIGLLLAGTLSKIFPV